MAFLRQWWGGEEAAIRNIISRNPWARLRIAASSPPISPQRQCHPERQRGIPRWISDNIEPFQGSGSES